MHVPLSISCILITCGAGSFSLIVIQYQERSRAKITVRTNSDSSNNEHRFFYMLFIFHSYVKSKPEHEGVYVVKEPNETASRQWSFSTSLCFLE